MTDKFRTTYPINIRFANGEQPTAKKLNAINSQTRAAFTALERAIGDLWNQGGDDLTSDFPLQITNLARTIGPQTKSNPVFILPDNSDIDQFLYTQDLTSQGGLTEIKLNWIPTDDATLATALTGLGFSSKVATKDLIDNINEWAVSTSDAKLYLGKALPTSSSLQYNVYTSDMTFDGDAANIIPNGGSDWSGLKISPIGVDSYYIVLPFRRPDDEVGAPDRMSATGNSAVIASPSTVRFWGPVAAGYTYTADISDLPFYRHKLSAAVRQIINAGAAGDTIPTGLLFLWNDATESIVEGVTFKIPSSPMPLFGSQVPFVLQIDGTGLDNLVAAVDSSSSTESASDYSTGFSLLSAGTSLSDSIHRLRGQLMFEDESSGFSTIVDHSDLSGLQPAISARHPFTFTPGYSEGDDHAYLLDRRGSTSTASGQRDLYNNGMAGDLLMLSTTSGTNYQNMDAASNRIYFGDIADGVSIFGSPLAGFDSIGGIYADAVVVSPGILSAAGLKAGNVAMLGNRDFGTGEFDMAFSDSTTDSINVNLWAKSLVLTGDSPTLAAWQTDHTPASQTDYLRLLVTSSGTNHLVEWKGAQLDFSAGNGESTQVLVGSANPLTTLRLASNRLDFGAVINNDHLAFDEGNNTFTFTADGATTTAEVVAGSLTLDNGITAGGNIIAPAVIVGTSTGFAFDTPRTIACALTTIPSRIDPTADYYWSLNSANDNHSQIDFTLTGTGNDDDGIISIPIPYLGDGVVTNVAIEFDLIARSAAGGGGPISAGAITVVGTITAAGAYGGTPGGSGSVSVVSTVGNAVVNIALTTSNTLSSTAPNYLWLGINYVSGASPTGGLVLQSIHLTCEIDNL